MKSKHRRSPGLWDRTVFGGDEYYVNKRTRVRYYIGGFLSVLLMMLLMLLFSYLPLWATHMACGI